MATVVDKLDNAWGWVMGVGAFAYSAKNKGKKSTVLQSTGACITRVRLQT